MHTTLVSRSIECTFETKCAETEKLSRLILSDLFLTNYSEFGIDESVDNFSFFVTDHVKNAIHTAVHGLL